jgi:hypothetical protein
MPFNLDQAIEILRTRYDSPYVHPYTPQNGLEADVGLFIDNKNLLIEISVEPDEGRITISNVQWVESPTEALQPLRFHDETSRYATDPRVLQFLERIKRDIGIP